jgi:hypothetical protein
VERLEGLRNRIAQKLKTPETEASGVSILITHSTTGVVPPAPPVADSPSSRWLSRPLAAPAQIHRLASTACTPARPVANSPARIGVVSFGSTGCEPPALTGCSALPTDHRRPSDSRRTILLRLGRQPTSDSHRMSSFGSAGCAAPAFTGCCPCLPGWPCLRLASAVSPSGFAGREPLNLRCAIPSSG